MNAASPRTYDFRTIVAQPHHCETYSKETTSARLTITAKGKQDPEESTWLGHTGMMFLIDPAARLIRSESGNQLSASMGFCRANGILQPVEIHRRRSWFEAIRQVAFRYHEQLFALQSNPELRLVSLSPQGRTNIVLVKSQESGLCDPAALNELSRLIGLSSREHQVLSLLADGMTPKLIASHQQIAVSTVRSQIKSIFVKSGASSIRDILHLLGRLPSLRSNRTGQPVLNARPGNEIYPACNCASCTTVARCTEEECAPLSL